MKKENLSDIKNSKWNFNENVPENFIEHISRSVPFYFECHQLILDLCDHYIYNDSIVYELGSSAGNLINSLSLKYKSRDCRFVGIDLSKEMVLFSKKNYKRKNLRFFRDDITKFNYTRSDIFISFYTFQFLKPNVREGLIKKIFKKLNTGGAFIFFEKTRATNSRFEDLIQDLYYEFKLRNDFSMDDIMKKRKGLVGVLEPYTSLKNIKMLKSAGFSEVCKIFNFYGFEGLLAIK